ncbi:helix-turn-helix domain-containing protein [Pseudochrobactrum kiredjianiae]|uniref:Helix-turn-helix domain-containing protein n=1 Tax=Pseudochrobactrum kiredjianiae TaxID=386305 RepID=A0ABW3V1J2_9HYPH|nr:helix-turn-helix transcriptional regulator [Pseudochrobactrum kiredjianiae]MDM7852343.1 helix-turn-helix transcriptional regulator [Pseudochrobactrum kiredjianiae]
MSKYHYIECGLDNVYINGLQFQRDDAGDEIITIPAINELHSLIATGIVTHEHGISGQELRYLRSEMGLTQSELAQFVHQDKQTIGRWERGEFAIDSKAEALIRRIAIEKLKLKVELGIEELSKKSVPSLNMQQINIQFENDNSSHSYELVA